MARIAEIRRKTKETEISLSLDLDGSGKSNIASGVPFFDHMLELFSRHGLVDLDVRAAGDLAIDAHHTVEDIGICLGQALSRALGDKAGINRYGDSVVPMDEALVMTAIDISGRSGLFYEVETPIEMIGTFDTSLTSEFLTALTNNADFTLHIKLLRGGNAHHVIEAVFKGLAKALARAVSLDPRVAGTPSTKGGL